MTSLGSHWERRAVRTALLAAALSFFPLAFFTTILRPAHLSPWTLLPLAAAGAVGVYFALTRKVQKRRAILSRPFPAEWETVLLREVIFFRALEDEEKGRFRRELQVFLGEKEAHQAGKILRRRQPAHGHRPFQRRLQLAGRIHRLQQRRIGRARADAVERNAIPGVLPGQRLHQGDGAPFGS